MCRNSGSGTALFTSVTLVNTDAPYTCGLRASIKYAITTAFVANNTNWQMQGQYIEGNNIQDLNWGQSFGAFVTVSFWSRTLGLTNLPVTIQNSAQTYSFNTNIAVASSGTWQYNTVTIPTPPTASVGTWDVAGSLTAVGLQVFIGGVSYGGAGLAAAAGWVSGSSIGTTASTPWITTAGNYVEFTGVQLEKGMIATPIECRPYAVEMQLCQRYYQKLPAQTFAGYFGNGLAAQITCPLQTMMRAPPICSPIFFYTSGIGSWTATGNTVTSLSTNVFKAGSVLSGTSVGAGTILTITGDNSSFSTPVTFNSEL
jgi:hypothetical protein